MDFGVERKGNDVEGRGGGVGVPCGAVSDSPRLAPWATFFGTFGAFVRLADDDLLIRGQRQICEVPLADEALCTGFAGSGRERAQVLRVVDVKRDARQREYDAGLAGGLGCGVVRLETVVAEARGEQAGGSFEKWRWCHVRRRREQVPTLPQARRR